ncbi:MAG: hypothetical protein ACRERE_01445 [Candidatus Entotheonellia bacterium]
MGDSQQIGSHDTPAHPAAQAGLSMIAAAVQLKAADQHADAPLDAGTKSEGKEHESHEVGAVQHDPGSQERTHRNNA